MEDTYDGDIDKASALIDILNDHHFHIHSH
jgi:hypothetical protein